MHWCHFFAFVFACIGAVFFLAFAFACIGAVFLLAFALHALVPYLKPTVDDNCQRGNKWEKGESCPREQCVRYKCRK